MTPNSRTEQIEEIAEVKNAEDVESVNYLSTSSTQILQRLRFFLMVVTKSDRLLTERTQEGASDFPVDESSAKFVALPR